MWRGLIDGTSSRSNLLNLSWFSNNASKRFFPAKSTRVFSVSWHHEPVLIPLGYPSKSAYNVLAAVYEIKKKSKHDLRLLFLTCRNSAARGRSLVFAPGKPHRRIVRRLAGPRPGVRIENRKSSGPEAKYYPDHAWLNTSRSIVRV